MSIADDVIKQFKNRDKSKDVELEVETLGRLVQPLAVLGELEDLAVIDALAFEHGAAIVQRALNEITLLLEQAKESE